MVALPSELIPVQLNINSSEKPLPLISIFYIRFWLSALEIIGFLEGYTHPLKTYSHTTAPTNDYAG
jgi:hypothetical protein